MARVLGLGLTTTSDAILVPGHVGAMASPPSPLLGSDTDTSSGTSAAAVTASPASVPKTFGFFRMARDGPEDAWKDIQRQRRSSLAQANRFTFAPLEPLVVSASQQMSRQRSSNSTGRPRSTASATSTDSLSSLWQSEQDLGINRTPSSGGGIRGMTPISGDNMPPNRRSSSDGPTSSAPRPLPRAAMSTTSLAGLPSPHAFPSEVGSAPTQTAFLIHSYASAFPARDGSPMLKPVPGLQTPDLRSSSVSNTPAPGLRSRPRTGSSTWDAFGKAEVRERHRRNTNGSSTNLAGSISREPSSPELNIHRERSDSISQATPKQSLEDGGWQIRYARPMTRQGSSRSRSASREPRTAPVPEDATSHATSLARPIPTRASAPCATAMSSSNSTARSRTPQSRLSGVASSARRTTVPDLAAIAALRIGSPCAPVVSAENASPRDTSRSIPRAGFDWNESHHRTYELPPGVVTNPNKGLFYFKA